MNKLIDDPILLTKKLIGFKSITPDDGGSLEFIASFVDQLGFQSKIFFYPRCKEPFCEMVSKVRLQENPSL